MDGTYHLKSGSPCADSGDPSMADACRPPGLQGVRGDMGAFGGESNCWWPQEGLYFSLLSAGLTSVPRGGTLSCRAYIHNIEGHPVDGNFWLSVLLPDSTEILIPRVVLNHDNPMSGVVQAFGSESFSVELSIPMAVETGFYTLIGRIGSYPNLVVDEERIAFEVIEGN